MPLSIGKSEFAESRMQGQEKRRGSRLNSRVPVKIEWEGMTGQACEEKAFTLDVSPYGCLLVLPAEIGVGQTVRVTNVAEQRSNGATVVWRGKKQPDGWELGIELIEPEMDFWGFEL
jgi:hypothetical protein